MGGMALDQSNSQVETKFPFPFQFIASAILASDEYVPTTEHITPTIIMRMQVEIWKLKKHHYDRIS